MKKIIATFASILVVAPIFAGEVAVGVKEMGSGTPGSVGLENAQVVVNDLRQAPGYLPQNPTAATIWPRTIEVDCVKQSTGSLNCEGYRWSPSMGRGEYIFIQPRVKEPVAPVIVERAVPFTVIKEVPAKKIRE